MLPTSIPFSKKEHLECIDLFADNTTELIEPMISFFSHGVYEKEDAISFINNANVNDVPEAFVVCGRERDEHYWNSAYIFKHDDGYFIEPDNMVPIQTRYAKTLKEAIIAAKDTVADHQKIIDED